MSLTCVTSILCQVRMQRILCNILEKEGVTMLFGCAGIAIVVVSILILIAMGIVF